MERINHIKKIIGHLIKYYRKQYSYPLNYYLETSERFISQNCTNCNLCSEPKIICSKNTLYRLEDGQIISNECVYLRLADKLNKKVILDQMNIYDKLENYRIKLRENLIDFSKTKLESLCEQIESDINKYKDVIYVYEMLFIYKLLIQDRLFHVKVKKEELDLILYLKDIVSDNNKKIILYYLLTGSFKNSNHDIDINKIFDESNQYMNDPLFYFVKLKNICDNNLLIAYREIINNEMPNIHLLTPYQKHELYSSLEYIQLNCDNYEEAYSSLINHLDIIQHSDFGLVVLKTCYLRLGIVTYALKRYDETIDWLLKAFNLNHFLAKDLALLCSSLEKTNQHDLIIKILNELDISKVKSMYGRELYLYYKVKYEKHPLNKDDFAHLEDLICIHLKPYLDKMGSLHKSIFDDDLKFYIKTTRNFKKYYEFNS